MSTSLSRRALLAFSAFVPLIACGQRSPAEAQPRATPVADPFADSPFRRLTDAEWRQRLPAAAYGVLRHEDTERPFTSELYEEHRRGMFVCAGCELPLFHSEWKYNSGTGWPSFSRVIEENVGRKRDNTLFMERTEYHCARCLGHQGHVFEDGPPPTGLRYCNNGVALKFVAA